MSSQELLVNFEKLSQNTISQNIVNNDNSSIEHLNKVYELLSLKNEDVGELKNYVIFNREQYTQVFHFITPQI